MSHTADHSTQYDDGPILIPIYPEGYEPGPGEGQSFVLSEIKWGSTTSGTSGGTVTWSFATANVGVEPEGVSFDLRFPTFFQQEIRDAFDAWEEAADINFVEVADSDNVDIRVGMDTDDGPGSTLGVAYSSFFVNPGTNNTFAQVHIVFDIEDYDGDEDSVEFLSTAIHEVGHALGLDHEDDVPAIMSTFSNPSINDLTSDDIAGAQAIYGAAGGFTGGGGTSDDFTPDSVATNGAVGAPGTVNGELETSGDENWFAVTLTAGRVYQIDMTGNTLGDPLLELRDSSGTQVASNDDGGPGLDSRITYTTTGTFYIVAKAFSTGSGTHTLTTQDLGLPIIAGIEVDEGSTDAGGDVSTTDSLIPGDTFQGTLDSATDIDWIAIDLTAGTEYTIDLQGSGGGSQTLDDGFLVLRDANGNFVVQDDNSGPVDDARLVYTPSSSGTFFVEVRTFSGASGTYDLLTSPGERMAEDPVPDPNPIIPGITISEGAVDATSATDTAAEFISGDTFEGELDTAADRDWVRIELTAGTEYTFDLEGVDTNGGTLDDPFMVLRDSSGAFVQQNDDSGTGLNSKILFTPDTSATYYL